MLLSDDIKVLFILDLIKEGQFVSEEMGSAGNEIWNTECEWFHNGVKSTIEKITSLTLIKVMEHL